MRMQLRNTLSVIAEEEEDATKKGDKFILIDIDKDIEIDADGNQSQHKSNTARNPSLCLDQNKGNKYRFSIPEQLKAINKSLHLKPFIAERKKLQYEVFQQSRTNEAFPCFENGMISDNCEKLVVVNNKQFLNKNIVSEPNKSNSSQNANTTTLESNPDNDDDESLKMIMTSHAKTNTQPQNNPISKETSENSLDAISQMSLENKFANLSIFAPQTTKENTTEMESASRAIVSSMLEKCIESIQKPSSNSRLSSRNSMSAGSSLSTTKVSPSPEMAQLENELEKKISTEKTNLERENDCHFSHGDGEALPRAAEDIELLRRQRMERLQQLRNMLDQKKTEKKEFDKVKIKIKCGMQDEKELFKMEVN